MRASILPAAAIGFILVAAIASPAAEAVSGPLLTTGDSWTYRTNTTIGEAFYLQGGVTLTTTDTGPFSVDGTSYAAFQFSVSGTGTANGTVATQFGPTSASGSWTLSGIQVVESAGLKLVSSVLDLEASGTLHTAPIPIPFQLSVQNTTTFRIASDGWRFPLEVGNSTVVPSRMNFSEDFRFIYGLQTTPLHTLGSLWWNISYALENQVAVDTPAGHFDAYRIRESAPDGTYGLFYYAPATGSDVRTETYNGSSRVATSELTSYRYQAVEPARLLGLTGTEWAIASLVVVTFGVTITAFWVRRHRRSTRPRTELDEPRR